MNWRRGLRRLAVAAWGLGLALLATATGALYDLHRPLENACAADDAASHPECRIRLREPLPDSAGAVQRWQRRVAEFTAPDPVDPDRVVPRWRTAAYQRGLRRAGLAGAVWTGVLVAALGVARWVARGFEDSPESA